MFESTRFGMSTSPLFWTSLMTPDLFGLPVTWHECWDAEQGRLCQVFSTVVTHGTTCLGVVIQMQAYITLTFS